MDEGQPFLAFKQVHFIYRFAELPEGFLRVRLPGQPPADHRPEAGIQHRPGNRRPGSALFLRRLDGHVHEAGGSGPEHFDNGQLRGPVNVLLRHALLHPVHVVQPVKEGQVVGVVPVDGHVGVGVGVDESRHHQLACRVQHPAAFPVQAFSDLLNPVPPDPEVRLPGAPALFRVLKYQAAPNQYVHSFLFPCFSAFFTPWRCAGRPPAPASGYRW